MKKSAQKEFQALLNKDTRPRSRKTDDLSDDLTKQFDDGTPLPSTKPTPATQGTLGTLGSESVAPARDFQKVANSITREAIPAGLFKGKSKQIYDYLYSRTRGAIVPTRMVQVTRREIMKGAGIGSDKTIRENLQHLRAVGLISWGGEIGAQDGSLYTVYLPEEIQDTPATQGTLGTPGYPGYFLPRVPKVETTLGTLGLIVDVQGTSEIPNTSFKTNTEKLDDEASRLARALAKAERELTGKNSAKGDQWEDLADVLITELRIAAGRTTVSSVPAFLAEHLRRRLWKKEKRQLEAESSPSEIARTSVDASQCPDCFGTGMWYPEGFDKGVARCHHEKLMPDGPNKNE